MVDLEMDGPVARITIRRPDARNALRVADWQALAERVAAAATARAILLTGEGGAFSAGADLRELATLADDAPARARFRLTMRTGIAAVAASPVPVIVAIGGGCFGAAVALALACDIRVAAPHATFGVPPARLGIVYPQGDVDRLVAAVGRGQASRLLLSAATIDSAEAMRIGLVDLIADDGGRSLADAIAGNVPASVALLRRQIGGLDGDEADRLFDDRFGSADFATAIARLRTSRA